MCWGKNTTLTHPSISWKVVRNCVITTHSSLCTRIQAGYQFVELWGYSAEGQESSEYISIHQIERLAEIHIGCQQHSAEVP